MEEKEEEEEEELRVERGKHTLYRLHCIFVQHEV